MSVCVLTPTIKMGGTEVKSKLFTELASFLGNRKDTIDVYGLTTVQSVRDRMNLQYNEQGEPTLLSVVENFNLSEAYPEAIGVLKARAGATDKGGNPIDFPSFKEAQDKAIRFNQDSREKNFEAQVIKNGSAYRIEIKKDLPVRELSREEANRTLNDKIRGYMAKLGFAAAVDNDLKFEGIFDPTNAKTNSEGLLEVIRIAHGTVGENALPEEFAHLMIEGLWDSPLVSRLIGVINNDAIIQEILGEEYSRYKELYKNDPTKLLKEAAGKLLADYIINGRTVANSGVLSGRVWGLAKSMFARGVEEDVLKMIAEYTQALGEEIIHSLNTGKVSPLMRRIRILNSTPFAKLAEELEEFEEFLKKAQKQLAYQRSTLSSQISDISSRGEVRQNMQQALLALDQQIEAKEFARGATTFIETVYKQLKAITPLLGEAHNIYNQLDNLNKGDIENRIKSLNSLAKIIMSIQEIEDTYGEMLDKLTTANLFNGRTGTKVFLGVELEEDEANRIANSASQIVGSVRGLSTIVAGMKLDVAASFVAAFMPEASERDVLEVAKEMLTYAGSDISLWEQYMSSMANSSDLLSSYLSKAMKYFQDKRNTLIEDYSHVLRAAHNELKMSGTEDTSFMVELNSEGVPTGRFISDVDYDKFEEARKIEYKKQLNGEDTPLAKVRARIRTQEWVKANTKEMELPGFDGGTVKFRIPDPAKYSSGNLTRANLTPAQRKYYDTVLYLKARASVGLPNQGLGAIHRSVMRRMDNNELIFGNLGFADKMNYVKSELQALVMAREDEQERGSTGQEIEDEEYDRDSKTTDVIVVDAKGRRKKTVPVFFQRKLIDMTQLSRDITGSMYAYIAMAANYTTMTSAVHAFELVKAQAHQREIQQYEGDRKLLSAVNLPGGKRFSKFTGKGGKAAERIDTFFDSNLYGETKINEGTMKLFGRHIDKAKAADSLKALTSHSSLGLNILSATSNIITGKVQLYIEATAGQFFNFKDLAVAEKLYLQNITQFTAELNGTNRNSKLALLMDMMNPDGGFFSNVSTRRMYRGVGSRLVGNTSLLFMQNIGEFYLNTKVMGAMMNHVKLLDKEGKEITLLDAFDVDEIKADNGKVLSSKLKLKEGLTRKDNGKPFKEADLLREKLRIKEVHHMLNGAFNEEDKGNIHRYAAGRLLMQFRQWMVATMERRFASKSFNAELDEETEGYYRTLLGIGYNMYKAAKAGKFDFIAGYKSLSELEKGNLWRATAEASILAAVCFMVGAMGSLKDNEDSWYKRYMQYLLMRTRIEMLAVTPTLWMGKGLLAIAKSPAASINTVQKMLDIPQVWNLFETVESGRWKGHNVYVKDMIELMPYVGNIMKANDLDTEEDMFKVLAL